MLRRILGRAELTEREARSLLGIINRIRWRIVHGQEDGDRAEIVQRDGSQKALNVGQR